VSDLARPPLAVATTASSIDLLGTRVDIQADDPDQLAGLMAVYRSVPMLAGDRVIAARLVRLTATSARLELGDGVTLGAGEHASAAGAATAFALLHHVVPAARDWIVLHAAVIERGSGPLLIVGPSGLGKTTLTVAAALRGARFASDELAVICRDSAIVLPFPRAVGIRPGPLHDDPRVVKACATAPLVEERGGRRKHLVDLIATGLARTAQPGPVRAVILLTADRAAPATAPRRLRLEVDRLPATLTTELAAVPGVLEISAIKDPAGPALRIVALPQARLARAIDSACARTGVRAVRFIDECALEPDYDRAAILTELGPGAGLPRLLRHVENGTELVDRELGGSAARLVLELGSLLGGARFYEMQVGELASAVELLERITP